ncbi:hypothetical protein [Pseudomonas serbica]|jgi:hypothetical protein|uniref:hypothetical protein n=1 Tax=Pseudomonas serbica TaxID=2965074 RepID=UPI00237A8E99|nr:hypothetical protein [Pseudomonas serbica]
MKFNKFFTASDKFKRNANLALFGLVGALWGAIAMNEYNTHVVYKEVAVAVRDETVSLLGGAASQKYKEGDKTQKVVMESMAKAGSAVSYMFLINTLRGDAFDASKGSLKYGTLETIAAADTHAADVLLLEAMDYLSNAQLSWLLDIHRRLFDQKIRFEIRNNLDNNDYAYESERKYDVAQTQTTLTELERSKLQGCAAKLQRAKDKYKAGDREDWLKEGLCSKETKYRPYDTSYFIDSSLFLRAASFSKPE